MGIENSGADKIQFSNLPIPAEGLRRKFSQNNPMTQNLSYQKGSDYQILENCSEAFERYKDKKLGLVQDGLYNGGRLLNLDSDQQTLRKIYGYKVPDGMKLDVYNITAPFELNGSTYIAGRLHARDSRYYSSIVFFKQSGKKWLAEEKAIQNLEDPFIAKIHGKTIFGGVRLYKDRDHNLINLVTLFFEMKSLEDLKLLAKGPPKMKDIRLVGLKKGKVGVFTRPQGEIGGRGQIGYITLNSIDDLNAGYIIEAPIIPLLFNPYEWGGVDDAHLVGSQILVLGHRAYWDNIFKLRRYRAWMFNIDSKSFKYTDLGIVAAREDFPKSPARSKELRDVFFPGGLKKFKDGWCKIYGGINDVSAGVITIPDPVQQFYASGNI